MSLRMDDGHSVAGRGDGPRGNDEMPPWVRRMLAVMLSLSLLWGVGLLSSASLVRYARIQWWSSNVEWENAVEHSRELQAISFGACEVRPKVSEHEYGYGSPDSYQVTIWRNVRSINRINESRHDMDAETARHKAYSKVMFDKLGTPEDARRAECPVSGQS